MGTWSIVLKSMVLKSMVLESGALLHQSLYLPTGFRSCQSLLRTGLCDYCNINVSRIGASACANGSVKETERPS
jgi:hypothetical protein